ncbi:MAG: hypothetical protein WDM70_03190 [Nitrosomonadales bacterium]
MKIIVSSIISSVPTLFIAVIVSVAIPTFAITQAENQAGSPKFQFSPLHDKLQLTGQMIPSVQHTGIGNLDKINVPQTDRNATIEKI